MMQRNDILNLLKYEPYRIGHFVGFRDLTELHNEWLRSFLYSKDSQTLLAHRGSYKTTTLSLFLALHMIIKPNDGTLFFRKTDTDVKEVIRQTQKILHSGAVQRIAYILYGQDLRLIKETDSEIHTNLCTTPKGMSQLLGLGIGTSITGKHGDVIVTDDIVNLTDRVSRAEREKTKTQYMELQNIVNRGGRFINTGTPWHPEDAISLMPNVKKYDCYSTGLMSREQIEDKRASMSNSLFAANYELKHIADKNALFTNPVFFADPKILYDGIAHIDAGYDGEDGTAFTIAKAGQDGNIYLFGKRWKKHVDDCLDDIARLHEAYRAGTIWCEDNADKGYLRKEIKEMGLPCRGYHESTNKFIKISTYLKGSWSRIKFSEATDPDYINEILDYNEFAEHDDCPDSAASIVRRLNKPQATFNRGITGGI